MINSSGDRPDNNAKSPAIGLSCQICGKVPPQVRLVRASLIRPAVVDLIRQVHLNWSEQGFICEDDLNGFRYAYVHSLVASEKGELSGLEQEVLESVSRHEILSRHADETYDAGLTFGQRLSDGLARFGGSWTFILFFAGVLVAWISINSIALMVRPFDPYPYILLNLILSCLAAVQAPIIMMSQNRQEARDRIRAAHDYQVNLKAELEIRQLHQKLDHLLSHQWERLAEIQEVQLEMLSELRDAGNLAQTDESTPPGGP